MDKYSVYVPVVAPARENFASGNRACVGCGEALALRYCLKALGPQMVVAMATGCMEIISSQFPQTSWKVPWIHTLFENTAAVASGIEAAYKVMRRKGKIQRHAHVLAIGGDGATADIGLQALSGALERGHDFVYICLDNEAYMNTGVQRSSSTPYGASTTTAPPGKKSMGQVTWKKDMPAIAAAHRIPYVATASAGYPFDLMEKVQKAAFLNGPAYVHVYSPCPTGWRSPVDASVKVSRLATESGVFPLYEIENGKYKLNFDFPRLRPITDYFKIQGRFRHLPPDEVQKIQERVRAQWEELKAKCQPARKETELVHA
ncbi:MAG: pyruvate synthase subunit beta [Chloroflexi bacterium]|nr:pyruvate synthase subunit beta [Chloroflexota bacterium]